MQQRQRIRLQRFQLPAVHFVTATTLSDNVDGIFHKDLFPSKNYGASVKDYVYYMVNHGTKDFWLQF
jgi:hypothetical protein